MKKEETDYAEMASAEIDRTLAEWASAVAEGDLGTIAALVSEDARFWTHGARPLVGRQAVVEAFKPFFEQYKLSQRFEVHERWVGPDWAFLRGLEINTLEPRNGGPRREIRQRAFSLLRRHPDGRWRFARGMTNQGPEESGKGEV